MKQPEILEEIVYRDTWGRGADSYIEMINKRLVLMRDLLAEDGSIFVHCDWRVNSYEIFLFRKYLRIIFFHKNALTFFTTGSQVFAILFAISKCTRQFVFDPLNVKTPIARQSPPHQSPRRIRKLFDPEEDLETSTAIPTHSPGERPFLHLGEFPTGKKPVGFQWKRCQHPTRLFV